MSQEPSPEAVSQFVERFASVMANSGVPSMSARVMGRMLVSPTGTMTASELAETLQISQPAVSGAVRQLIQVAFISRERLPGSRKDHYRIRDDVFASILERRNNALGEWESSTRGRRRPLRPRDAGRAPPPGSLRLLRLHQRRPQPADQELAIPAPRNLKQPSANRRGGMV
ncbi:MarR family transcriptional regulator [Kribbella qitaiheensis]|uniref:MarR family transcriptional regulator n=1 Tax=Kribbella qitaiheensis TaxID=1544730 RepID=A0A7G6WU02_9ACTN|nr:MarR family transcriptional regulator [Kribbella qitaiheensis]QNE17467.1 MarR family transcriptional regulator [Kribbella qitaiheensis]